jgi:hypothetical protein
MGMDTSSTSIPIPTTTTPLPAQSRLTVPVADVFINADRDRRGEGVNVGDLVKSFQDLGLLQPLVVLPQQNGKYELLAGHRRLRAAQHLEWTEISVQVITLGELQAKLATMHENLVRKQLPRQEGRRQMAEAKKIYETLHPETKHGGKRGGRSTGHGGNSKKTKSFVAATAEATGRSVRAVNRDIKIAEDGVLVLQDAVDAGKIKLSAAERIAGHAPEEQEKMVAEIINGPHAPANEDEEKAADLAVVPVALDRPTPASLAEAAVRAARDFRDGVVASEIDDPEKILALAQQVKNAISEVTMQVRAKYPMKPTTNPSVA